MSHILTAAGTYFDFTNPDAFDYDVEIIAHGLSHINRFTGHTYRAYSVAQHCVLAAEQANTDKLEVLMHDASEALLGDVASPLKALLPDYRALEARVELAIAKQHALRYPHPSHVKVIDLRMLRTERRDLMPPTFSEHWDARFHPYPFTIIPWSAEFARQAFIDAYHQYNYERIGR